MFQQLVKVAVVPLRGMGGPGAFQAAADGVAAYATAHVVDPAQALIAQIGGLGHGAQVLHFAIAMGLANGMAASGQGHGLFVIHGHAGKGEPHILRGTQRVGLAAHAFGVDVNQPHLNRGQRVFQGFAAFAFVAGRRQPLGFRAPIDVELGVPDVLAPQRKTVARKPHRLVGHGARQHDQVGPADVLAILLFKRPQQAARLVQAHVVGPGVERGEALVARAGAATAVGDAVGTRGMPGHANHQAAVMPPVGRPPVLAVGHKGGQVFFQRAEV